jgi:hypothetical protein
MKITSEEKDKLTEALRITNNLPPSQGKVTLNISAELKVAAVEINFLKR